MNSSSITYAPVIPLEAARAEAEPWPTPISLSCPPPPTLDLEKAIPPGLAPFREFCAALAEALQVSPDAVPPLALALASIGTARALELEMQTGWRETAPLWFVVLGLPGERKSPIMTALAAPLHKWEQAERQYLNHALATYHERRRILEARLTGTRAQLQRAKGPEVSDLERRALELAGELETLPPLAVPALITSNATPEAMRDLLVRNGEKLALVSAESDAEQLLGSRYAKSGSPNLDLFLSAYSGDACSSHRVGRDALLARPALTLALCVQPEAVGNVLCNSAARGRGFVDRMALIHPPSRQGTRILHPEPLPDHLREWWSDTMHRLLSLPWPGRVILDAKGPTRCEAAPRVLRLSPDAVPILDTLRADLESRVGEGKDLAPISGFVSKLPGVVGRVALALEAMHDSNAGEISAETMRAACEWAPFLLAHFRAVLGDAAASDETKTARRVLAWLKRKGRTVVTAREIHMGIDGDGLRREELDPALDLLVEGEWLRELPRTGEPHPGRPPSPRYAVNPAALA